MGERKVWAPPDRVLDNVQAPPRLCVLDEYGEPERRRTVAQKPYRLDSPKWGFEVRVKTGGKSARPFAATRRWPNPTWSKAK